MQILTHNGFKSFGGFISQGIVKKLYRFYLSNGEFIDCTEDHRFLLNNLKFKYAFDINENDIFFPNVSILNKEIIDFNDEVFDAINVKDVESYWTNGVISHNCALLVLDEFAFVRANVAEEFFTSIYPSISSSNEAKIIVLSTPNGIGNLFHKIFTDAEAGKNTFKSLRVTWEDVPGRDEKWAATQIKNLGKVKFSQEQGCTFIGSMATVIDAEALKRLLNSYEYPQIVELDNHFRIYETPVEGAMYLIGVDVAKGTGEHYSVCQILKVDSVSPLQLDQVATFESNDTDVYTFAEIIHRIAMYYNKAYVAAENNMGDTVITRLWWHYEYENLINESSKSTGLGIRATNKSKPAAVLLMKRLLENGDLRVRDKRTVQQLAIFVEKNGKFMGNDDKDDDLVSGLYWGCYATNFDIFGEFSSSINIKNDDDGWGILTDFDYIPEDSDFF